MSIQELLQNEQPIASVKSNDMERKLGLKARHIGRPAKAAEIGDRRAGKPFPVACLRGKNNNLPQGGFVDQRARQKEARLFEMLKGALRVRAGCRAKLAQGLNAPRAMASKLLASSESRIDSASAVRPFP